MPSGAGPRVRLGEYIVELPEDLQRELDDLLEATAEGIGAALGRYGYPEGSVLVQALVRANESAAAAEERQ